MSDAVRWKSFFPFHLFTCLFFFSLKKHFPVIHLYFVLCLFDSFMYKHITSFDRNKMVKFTNRKKEKTSGNRPA